jgi:hypothetical protein|tara:strand:+ start:2044 stop:2223 length:180 start_codon:yes stop_codon:yes gene_type:complete
MKKKHRQLKKINSKLAFPMHFGSIIGNRGDAQKFSGLASSRVEILGKGDGDYLFISEAQ